MFTILHISDLHRSQAEPIDNASLIASLVADSDRYLGETPRIPRPGAIVVSGDLIQGVPLGTPDWKNLLDQQYKVAESFLNDLCNRFLDGDRTAMIIVPGNHDVCWNTSRSSMVEIVSDRFPDNLYQSLVIPGTNYRWSWHNRQLFKINNDSLYQERMDCYWEFVERFYDGFHLPLSLNRERGFHLFEVHNRRILFAAFESIHNNDCFSNPGALAAGVVGKCAIDLRDSGRSYDLKIAVWHHGIQGPPLHSDYMDAACVQEMAGHGFQIGLHGHQHISQTITQYVHIGTTHAMAIIGAGSLCAGTGELPRGQNRQYNLLVIEDDFLRGRVHVREMGDGHQFSRKRNGPFPDGFIETAWQPASGPIGDDAGFLAHDTRAAIEGAEAALLDERTEDAIRHLEHIDVARHGYAKKLKLEAVLTLEDWEQVLSLIREPETTEETVFLLTALIESGRLEEAQECLSTTGDLDTATRSSLQERIDTKRMMGQS